MCLWVMMAIAKNLLVTVLAVAAQLLVAPLLQIGDIRPDFMLILLVYFSARYGRLAGVIVGFTIGLLQDVTGSYSVLGATAMSKSLVGYVAGTLNGNLSIWTARVVNMYIYGSLALHAIVYQLVMVLGLRIATLELLKRILTEFGLAALMIAGLRYMIPLVRSR